MPKLILGEVAKRNMSRINPNILSWARNTAGLEPEEAAHKLQIQDSETTTGGQKLLSYESGEQEPSRSLLLRMSKVYRRPLLTFYLDRPPVVGDRGEDFRTLPEEVAEQDLAYVDALIREIKARQSIARSTLLDDEEVIRLTYVASITANQSTQQVVNKLQQVLNIDRSAYRAKTSYEEAFKYLRTQAEAAGIFVLLKGNLGSHHTNIDVRAFRGFVLSDDIAPFIVINDRDAKSAWSFTLLHEATHLLLGQTGISGGLAERRIEKFCNDVASEILLPESEFTEFNVRLSQSDNLAERISHYAFSVKVSSTHVAYRLFKRGDIDKAEWEALRDQYRNQWMEQRDRDKKKSQGQEGGPSYYVIQKFRLGALVSLAQRLNYSGQLSTTKAGLLLDVRPLKVHRLFNIEQVA